MTKKPINSYLFYIAHNYSFEILRPLQDEIIKRGDQVRWFTTGNEVNLENFSEKEHRLQSIEEVIAYQAKACFVPGNTIPNFIPGLKVQVFHGLEWKKKGHFVIRNCFDLYCTHGEATTSRFNALAEEHGYFDVVETGWPKLDRLFSTPAYNKCPSGKKVILYAPTFSPSLTSAPALFDHIKQLAAKGEYHWIVKFHPKMDATWIKKYQELTAENLEVIDSSDISALLQCADIMISDTSSVIGEFALLGKPVVTLNNNLPGDYLINITQADQLPQSIEQAFTPNKKLTKAINEYARQLHPYHDGQASSRILAAVDNIMLNGKKATKKMPPNIFRNLKLRLALSYWHW
jgi:CDP-glycerol glycerophosphotransferase (TagB/SpsB family)